MQVPRTRRGKLAAEKGGVRESPQDDRIARRRSRRETLAAMNTGRPRRTCAACPGPSPGWRRWSD